MIKQSLILLALVMLLLVSLTLAPGRVQAPRLSAPPTNTPRAVSASPVFVALNELPSESASSPKVEKATRSRLGDEIKLKMRQVKVVDTWVAKSEGRIVVSVQRRWKHTTVRRVQ